ncbi:MAG TPA: L,D-transpeptidase [Longimicrobiaceae bacterium]|nr:L,D-transpeptidase [Longimicrobiaceae bacterium]
MRRISVCISILTGALLAGLGATPPAAAAQTRSLAIAGGTHEGGGGGDEPTGTALARGRYAVVVNLDENRLYFKQGTLTLWSAPIGTGTGLELRDGKEKWDFSTPRGVFHVKYKEKDPVWIAPDWFYVENKLPVPPPNDPKRYFPGGLGAAAVYLDHDLAIHGTDKPELVGQRVSHGCIRLRDRDALRLYHDVQVGTEVVIVGRAHYDTPAPAAQGGSKTFDPEHEKPTVDRTLEGWKKLSTDDLLVVLGDELWLPPDASRWTEVAGLLLDRATKEQDTAALEGLLSGLGDLPSTRVEREYSAFLADAYSRAPLLTLQTLSRLDHATARRAAKAIVTTTMNLYNGDFTDPGAPWPTQRIPRSQVDDDAEAGWTVLVAAEQAFRASHGPASASARDAEGAVRG